MSAQENYANQEKSASAQPSDMTTELHSRWHTERNNGEMHPDTVQKLVDKAHAGSWMAGNMLHLSGIEWDCTIDGQPYTYGLATIHGDRYSTGAINIYDRGRDIDES